MSCCGCQCSRPVARQRFQVARTLGRGCRRRKSDGGHNAKRRSRELISTTKTPENCQSDLTRGRPEFGCACGSFARRRYPVPSLRRTGGRILPASRRTSEWLRASIAQAHDRPIRASLLLVKVDVMAGRASNIGTAVIEDFRDDARSRHPRETPDCE